MTGTEKVVSEMAGVAMSCYPTGQYSDLAEHALYWGFVAIVWLFVVALALGIAALVCEAMGWRK